jgi:hypothetical protein
MSSRYDNSRPDVPAEIRRQALIEAGHCCSVAHCIDHTYLELHHINENREDNRLENVIILCDKHHKMAHAGVIDRKALQEYKRLNREKLGLSDQYNLPAIVQSEYLIHLDEWATQKQSQLTTLPLQESTSANVFLPTVLQFGGKTFTDEANVFDQFQNFLNEHRLCMLLGNGGSGKTFFLLNWLHHICKMAQKNASAPIPVFLELHRLTTRTNLLKLIRAAFGKQGADLTDHQVEILLNFGRVCVILDGLNEINLKAVDDGAYEDILNFLDSYSNCLFVVSSRFLSTITEWQVPRLEIRAWNPLYIRRYLLARLGTDLGEQTYNKIGDNLDFEWLLGCSIAGVCSNPLTLWMLTVLSEENQEPFGYKEDIVDALVTLSIERNKRKRRDALIIPRLMHEVLEDFAYFMIEQGEVLSTTYESAIDICARILKERRESEILPANIDAYQLLIQLLQTGLLRQPTDKTIEWLHQILQEKLSINASDRRFGEAINLARSVDCPSCGHRPEDYFEQDGFLYGVCNETENCSAFRINLPIDVNTDLLREKIVFVDHTGAPREYGQTSISNSFIDERWMFFMPVAGMSYVLALSNAQDNEIDQVNKIDFLKAVRGPELAVSLEIKILMMSGMLQVVNDADVSYIHIFQPPVNPSLRLLGYQIVTLRSLSFDELQEDAEERFLVTSAEKEQRMAERKKKNLPIYHSYLFVEEEKEKAFQIAQKFGGQVLRTWGPYEEVVAEFPGEAWDFSSYASG